MEGNYLNGGGQTKSNVSGWSTDTLKEYVERVLEEHDKRYDQRFFAQQEAMRSALASAEKAVEKAENIAEKWRQNANEWREAMSDKDKTYQTKETADSRLIPLEKFMERRAGLGHGLSTGWGYLVSAAALLASIAAIIISFIK